LEAPTGGARAADLPQHVHVAAGDFEPLLAAGVVVDDPLTEADGAIDAQPGIGDAFAQVGEVAAAVGILVQLVHPRLDGAVAGLGGDLDLLHDAQHLPADGAGVEAVGEGIAGALGRGARRASRQPRGGDATHFPEPAAARKFSGHGRCSPANENVRLATETM
jgi:hypothetical protein